MKKIFLYKIITLLVLSSTTSVIFSINLDKSLLDASATGTLEKIKELIASGANINAKNTQGNTPLILATDYLRLNIVEFLLNLGADARIKNTLGKTALNFAQNSSNSDDKKVREKNKELEKMLRDALTKQREKWGIIIGQKPDKDDSKSINK